MRSQETGRKVKIAVIAFDLSIGGIQEVVTNYTARLDPEKFEAAVFAGKPVAGKYRTMLEAAGVRVTELPARAEGKKAYYAALRRALSGEKYDIAHVHGSNAAMTPELVIARLCGIPQRIAHCHSTIPWNRTAHTLMMPVFKRVYTKAFACGEKAGEWIFGKGNFTVIRNGFSVEKFLFSPETRQKVREDLGLDGRFVIGHVGGLNPIKNQSFIMEIFEEYRKEHPEAYLLLAGDGPDREMLEAKAAASPAREQIRLSGNTDRPEELLAAMDCFLFPSTAEGLPIALLEAQAAGLPCVISDVITDEAVLSESVRKMSLDRSAAEWAKALPKAPRTDEERANLPRQAAEKLNAYSIDACVGALEEEYLKCAEAGRK